MGSIGSTQDTWFQDRINSAVANAAAERAKEEGWAVIPDVLTAEETALVLSRLWDVAKKIKEGGTSTYVPYLDPNESNVRIADLVVHDKVFCDLVEHPLAVKVVQDIIGEDYIISNYSANIARPGSKSMALHSDQSLSMPEPWQNIWAINVIWCLSDVYFENGATLYIPGSNHWKRMEEIPKDAKKLLKPFEAKAGSILLMTGRVWHTSGCNITKDQDRALLLAYYTVPFLRHQMNWSMRISPQKAKEFSPQLIQRLGMTPAGNEYKVDALRYLDEQYPDEDVALLEKLVN